MHNSLYTLRLHSVTCSLGQRTEPSVHAVFVTEFVMCDIYLSNERVFSPPHYYDL